MIRPCGQHCVGDNNAMTECEKRYESAKCKSKTVLVLFTLILIIVIIVANIAKWNDKYG